MSSLQRSTLRAAISIHQVLTRPAPIPRLPEFPDILWNRACRSLQAWQQATSRRWMQAARVVRQRLDDDLQPLIQELDQCRYAIHREIPTPPSLSLRDLINDLRSLQDEFDQVTINLRERRLSVTTEPIDLEGLELGPFSILLDWNRLTEHGSYRIVAEYPNPAHSNEEVTHPHVHDERLCEGGGHLAIRQSLQEGRLLDFFILVRQVLRTYNPSSPYVAIENWQGVPCHDCGSLTGEEYDICHACESTICFDCSNSCDDCGERCCGRCLDACRGCDRSFCPHCLRDCEACGDTFCQECLIENDTCQACLESQEEEADASLHPDGVGQDPLPT